MSSAAKTEKMPMRHYEIVAVIHPDQHSRAGEMAERYKKIIAEGGGVVHRFEDWGLRALAYPMRKQKRAQYILLNIECGEQTLGELEENFRFSEAVMRTLVLRREEAVTKPSPIMQKIREEKLAAANAPAKVAAAEGAPAEGGKSAADKKPEGDKKAESESAEAKDAKPARKPRAKKVADDEGEGEGDSDVKAPRKSPAKTRRAKSESEAESESKDEGGGEQ